MGIRSLDENAHTWKELFPSCHITVARRVTYPQIAQLLSKNIDQTKFHVVVVSLLPATMLLFDYHTVVKRLDIDKYAVFVRAGKNGD